MGLHRIVYVSRPNPELLRPTFDMGLAAILRQSVERNRRAGLSGMLLANHATFVQVLEGPQDALSDTLARIVRDPRHRDVMLFEAEEAHQRYFGEWSMHFGHLDALQDSSVSRVVRGRRADPYRMDREELLALSYAIAEMPAASPLLRLDRLALAAA